MDWEAGGRMQEGTREVVRRTRVSLTLEAGVVSYPNWEPTVNPVLVGASLTSVHVRLASPVGNVMRPPPHNGTSEKGGVLSRFGRCRSGKWDLQSVVRQLDMIWQRSIDGMVIQVAGTMREIGLARAKTLDHCHGFFQVQVRRVRVIAQSAENQSVQAFQKGPGGFGDFLDVGAVGDIANAKTQDVKAGAVFQGDWLDLRFQDLEWLIPDGVKLQAGSGTDMGGGLIGKRVVEGFP